MPQKIGTVMGTFIAYGHEVLIETLNYRFESYAFFAANGNFGKNVLGRRGWLDLLRVGVIDYDGELYVSRY